MVVVKGHTQSLTYFELSTAPPPIPLADNYRQDAAAAAAAIALEEEDGMCHHFPTAAFIIEHHFIAPHHFHFLSSLELSLITVLPSSLSLPKSSLDLHQLCLSIHPSLFFFFPSVIIFIFIFIFVVVVVYRSVPVLIIGPLLLLLLFSGFPIHPVHYSLSLSFSSPSK